MHSASFSASCSTFASPSVRWYTLQIFLCNRSNIFSMAGNYIFFIFSVFKSLVIQMQTLDPAKVWSKEWKMSKMTPRWWQKQKTNILRSADCKTSVFFFITLVLLVLIIISLSFCFQFFVTNAFLNYQFLSYGFEVYQHYRWVYKRLFFGTFKSYTIDLKVFPRWRVQNFSFNFRYCIKIWPA